MKVPRSLYQTYFMTGIVTVDCEAMMGSCEDVGDKNDQ